MNVWFASDHHLNHKNIINYGNRPFNNLDEMSECIIERHNSVVKPDDIIYFLGDFLLCSKKSEIEPIVKKFNGRLFLLCGNHERWKCKDYINAGFEWCTRFPFIYDKKFIISHEPLELEALNNYYKNIHGHLHQKDSPDKLNYYNCSMEKIAYLPVHYETIRKLLFC